MPKRAARHDALRIAVTYAVIALLWIVGTDFLTRAWVPDVEQARWFETLKGAAFAVGTGALLFWWVRRVFVEREEELRDLRTLTEQVPDFVFRLRLRPEVAFEYVSPAVENLVGFTPDELYQHLDRVLDAVHPEDRQRLRGLLADPDSIGDSVELRWLHKDGRTVNIEFRVTRLRNQEGHVEAVEGIARDVTERAEARERVEESARLLRKTLSALTEAVLVVGVGGRARRISDVNRATEEMFGYDRNELIGETTEKLHVDRQSFERFGRVGGEALEDAGVYQTTFPMKRRDGEIFEAEQTVTLLDPQRGIDGGAVSVIRDVSEKKEAEARLRESRDRFQTLFRANPAGIIVTRVDDGTVTDVNDAYLHIIGYDREEVLGRTTTELGIVDPESRTSAIRELAEADVGFTDQFVLRRKDGGEALVLASVEEITLRGEPHLLVMAQDITEYRSLERQLREAQKMEAVGRLAGGIAHDFNNLLTVIRSQADMVLMDLGVSNPAADDMRLIRESADRAARLTRQLLAFSREQVLEPRVVDLNEMLRGMRDLLERTLGEQVRIRTDFEEGLDPIRVDPAQLEQVVVNLAVNARDAMPEGGTLTLSTGTEEGSVGDEEFLREGEGGGPVVKLAVSDTGVGMDQETMERIFEPFFTTKRDSGGTGLGLATSYGIVRQSGGTIEVSSVPGSGSTFVLRFPAAEGPVDWPEAERSEAEKPGAVDARVLVVEDDPSVRAVTTKILERAGVRVRTAEDVAGARRLIEDSAEDLDLLLTDLVLPGGSGRELVDLARSEASHLKVLVMSGYTQESPGSRGDLPRDVGFIQKPFSPETLLTRINEMLAGG